MRRASNKQLHFEIALIRAVQSLDEVQISDVIRALEVGNTTGTVSESPREQPAEAPAAALPKSPEALPKTPPTTRTSARARKKNRGVENQLE